MRETKTRLELVKAVEGRNETVVLCVDGHEVAEIRRRPKTRTTCNLTRDLHFRVELAPGYRPTDLLSQTKWPHAARRPLRRVRVTRVSGG